jgi:protein-S-isoprenylcysteine O-methyltransferase Ste14
VTILVYASINVTDAGPRHMALPFVIHDHLWLGIGALGLVATSFSIGSVVGVVVIGRLNWLRHRATALYAGAALGGLMLIGYGLAPDQIALLAAAFIYHITFSAMALLWTNSVQEMVHPDMLGLVVRARREERVLPQGFGQEWRESAARVPGWLPRMRRDPPPSAPGYPEGRPGRSLQRKGPGRGLLPPQTRLRIKHLDLPLDSI